MLIEARKFMFTVSLCAMLVVNPVLATAPESDDDLDTTHDVYVESTLPSVEGYQTVGIAGVSYVNRMVDAAGSAAQAAEGHAAAAGAYALSAAESADEAHKVLAGKVDEAQGSDNKNKVMVTNADGTVYPGYVTSDMIADSAIYSGHIANGAVVVDALFGTPGTGVGVIGLSSGGKFTNYGTGDTGHVMMIENVSGHAAIVWGQVNSSSIAANEISSYHIRDGAILAGHIATGAIQAGHIESGAIQAGHIATGAVGVDAIDAGGTLSYGESNSSVLLGYETGNGEKVLQWGKVKSAGIADGAVTIDKTDGIVGMVPVGSADATTYANFWIE